MRKFITHSVIFICPILIILLIIIIANKYFPKININKNKNILILGNSHPECAFNDSLIEGTKNYAKSGECYFYTYVKTRLILEHNPQIRYVLIEFGNNQIEKSSDDWIWADFFMSFHFPRNALFMNKDELKLLYLNNYSCFKKSIIPIFKYSVTMLFKGLNYDKETGGYAYLNNFLTETTLSRIKNSRKQIAVSPEISLYNLLYLEKILNYCKKKNIKVLLIRCPVHEKYPGSYNETKFQVLIKTRFASYEFLDFTKFPLSNNDLADLEHLNHFGATKFSRWFNVQLKNGLLEKSDKQAFINEQIKKFNNEFTNK
jgi:hypothetical protein